MNNNRGHSPMNFNNQGSGQQNPFANMFGGSMMERPPLGKTIKRWIKIILYLIIFISFLQGCFADGSGSADWGKIPDGENSGNLDNTQTFAQAWSMSGFFGIFFLWPLTQGAYFIESTFAGWGLNAAIAIILTIFVIVVFIKGGTLIFMWKNIKQQSQMQEMQSKMAEIKAKYAGRTDKAARQLQSAETMALYSKAGINPFASIGTMFITMPFFFAMYRLISNVKLFQESELLNHNFSNQIVNLGDIGKSFSNPPLLILVIVTTVVQVTAMLLPQIQAKKRRKSQNKILTEAAKQQMATQQKMMYIMALVFILIIMNLPLGLTIYWFMTGTWSIFQTLLVQQKIHKKNKNNKVKVKSSKPNYRANV